MRCGLCSGGKAHHAVPGESCWCPQCLRKPESERCSDWQPTVADPTRGTQASVKAAKLLPRAGSLKRQIYDWIDRAGLQGATDAELEYKTGKPHETVSGARVALMDEGLIIDSGIRRDNQNGNAAIAWRTTTLNS